MKNNNYSRHSLNQKSKAKFTTDWAFKEGVFPVNDYFICRVHNGKSFTTLSKHETEDLAQDAYNDYNNKKLTK